MHVTSTIYPLNIPLTYFDNRLFPTKLKQKITFFHHNLQTPAPGFMSPHATRTMNQSMLQQQYITQADVSRQADPSGHWRPGFSSCMLHLEVIYCDFFKFLIVRV